MKRWGLMIFLIVFAGGFYYFSTRSNTPSPSQSTRYPLLTQEPNERITVMNNLEIPWAIAFLPDGSMLVTERPGRVQHIVNGATKNTFTIVGVKHIGEGGLLGITLHPDFSTNLYIYLYYTYTSQGENTLNRVVRMKFQDGKLMDEKVIIDRIPGASNHNGGRIKFGPDKLLYIGTGDAQNPSQAQDINTLGGKILRSTDEGKPPSDNPFGNLIYSYGHRNVQGLAWNSSGNLWATEHGRSGLASGLDEINFIERGKNYGWPEIEGDEIRSGMETSRKNSGSTTTWAPAGASFSGNSLFFGGLRGQSLYEAVTTNNQVINFREYFKGEYGRIREVILGSDDMLYITTSNRDGRGNVRESDDKIIRINPKKL